MNRVNVPQLRFPRFDGKWEKKKLGDVLNITSAARVHKDEWTEEGVSFFRSSDVVAAFNGKQNIKAYIPFDLYNSLSKKIGKVKIDDLLITGGGSIGIPFLIEKNDPLYFKDADLLWIKNNGNISGYFLYSFFLTPLFKNHLKSVSHIGTIAHYTVIQAKNTPFNTPSLPEQQKIASFLSAVDEKIKQLSRKKELLEQYKKGVMQQLFSGKLRFKDENGNYYADWEEKVLGDVLDLQHGYQFRSTDFTNSGLAIIKISNVIGSSLFLQNLSFINANRLEEFKKFEINKGDILMSLTGNIGRVIEVESIPFKLIQNYRVGKFVPFNIEYLSNKFTKHLLMSDAVFGRFGQLSNQSAQANFGKQDMDKIHVTIPLIKEQQKITTFLSSIDGIIENVNQQITQTQSFKKGLLQQMFV
jgi:type I restriction enzyme S subunit